MRIPFVSLRKSSTPPPTARRVYAIGDVHGRYDLMAKLLLEIERDSASREPARTEIVILGDFIDRGPSSAEVVAVLGALRARDGLVVLKGNHEAALVDAWRGDQTALALWLDHGGDATLRSLGAGDDEIYPADPRHLLETVHRYVSRAMIKWLASLPLSYRVGDYFFVHAGIRPGVPLAEQAPEDMLWIREEFTQNCDDHGLIIVHGHTISDRVAIHPNRIGVDTGAYRTGRLAAVGLEIDSRWIIEVSSDA